MTRSAPTSQEASGVTVGWVGSLGHTPLAEVIRRIVLEERSGDLQITSSSAVKTIYFDRGFIVFASSDLKSDRLGESMIEAGRISRREFFLASMLMQRGNRKFGQALVQAGIVSEEELGRWVAAQVNRIVLSLFSVHRGMYSFDERPCIIPLELMVSLSVYRIFLEGIRRMTNKTLIIAGLPRLDTTVKIVDAPPFTLDIEKLRPIERAVLRSIRNGASLFEITKTIGGDDGKVLRACYGLYAAGIMEGVTLDARKQPTRVQMETGTFVLSEIRQKVEKKRIEAGRSVTPPHPEGSEQSSENDPPSPSATTPAIDSTQEPESHADEDSFPAAGETDLKPDADSRDDSPPSGQEAFTDSTSSPFQLAWHSSRSLVLSVAASIFKLIRRLITRASQESQEEKDSGQTAPSPAESVETRGPLEQEPAFILEDGPKEQKERIESDRSPVEPERWEAKSKNLNVESVGVPSWSLLDDSNTAPSTDSSEKGEKTIESVGVPSWSMKDDPRDNKQSPELNEKTEQPVPENLESPDWAVMDSSGDLEESPLSYEERESESSDQEPIIEPEPDEEDLGRSHLPVTATSRPPTLEPESADQMLATTDHDLFVQQELEEEHEPSMLSPIALDEIVLEEDSTELDSEYENEMFSKLPESIDELISASEKEAKDDSPEWSPKALEIEAPAAPVVPEPASSREEKSVLEPGASPPTEKDKEENETSSKPEDPMEAVRFSQRGGEAKLFRDVKLHFNFQDYEGAIPLLEQLVRFSPGTALYRGMLARALSRYPPTAESAEEHFIEALRLSPQDPELHYWLGLYYKKFGLKARATNEFRTTLRIDANHQGARKQLQGGGKRGVGGVLKKLFG